MRSSFPQGKFNSSGSYSSTLCPYFIHPLHAIISRNISRTQNYITKCKKCFTILKKNLRLQQGKSFTTLDIFTILKKNLRLQQDKSFTTLGIFTGKWISKDNLNADFILKISINIFRPVKTKIKRFWVSYHNHVFFHCYKNLIRLL